MSDQPHVGAVLYAADLDRFATFYASVLGFTVVGRDDEHVCLESPTFQLVILRAPHHLAATPQAATPPTRRANAAIKLVFIVPSIAEVRASVQALGGDLNGANSEWLFDGCTVCDGLDPEGNVIQFREPAGE